MKHISYILFALLLGLGCKRDACDEVICRNDGYCDNGDCVCEEGFSGIQCQNQKTPKLINLNDFMIESYPESGNWDPVNPTDGSSSADPDIYLMVYQHGQLIYDGYETVTSDFTALDKIKMNVAIHKEGFEAPISFKIYDRDFGGRTDELVFEGTLSNLYDSKNAFPTTLQLNSGQASSKVSISYTW
jgi:hypothetical protein